MMSIHDANEVMMKFTIHRSNEVMKLARARVQEARATCSAHGITSDDLARARDLRAQVFLDAKIL